MRVAPRFFILFAMIISAATAGAQVLVKAFPHLTFNIPILLTTAPDGRDRIYVVQQDGFIKVFPNDSSAASSTTFFDHSVGLSNASGEEGLLGLAFDPNFASNGYFYVNYTVASPLRTRVSRYRVMPGNPDLADMSSEFIIFEINQPYSNHNGGCLAFGQDGYLYIGMGDGGSGGDPQGNGQNLKVLLGKMLRIDVSDTTATTHYKIPPDNPFALNASGYKQEIWAYGLRNPWRFSFDPTSGALWCADVGQGDREEVDIIVKGGNYGWNVMEGFACYPPGTSGCDSTGMIPPIKDYTHSVGNAVVGGAVYHGSRRPDLVGSYIYADYGFGNIWMLRYDGKKLTADSLVTKYSGNISSFGTDKNGELYIVTHSFSGPTSVYRFASRAVSSVGSGEVPQHFGLEQNYPNPFNPSTMIRYALAQRAFVKLAVYDLLGREVAVLVNGEEETGNREIRFDGSGLASGVYFYKLQAGEFTQMRKLLLLR